MSPVRLLDVAAPLFFDDSPAARASIPGFHLGVTPAETCFLHSRRLGLGLPHQKQIASFAMAAVPLTTARADR